MTGAGEHQVADAGEAGEGFAARAAGHGEAGDLGDAAGDERGGGVVAEADADGDAGGDGDDVLERAAQLDANDIGGRVEAEGLGGEFLLDERGDLRVAEGDGDGGGLALRHFNGEAGPGERADGEQKPGRLEGCGEHLRHAAEGVVLNALGGADHELAGAQMRADAEQRGAEKLRGNDGDNDSAAVMAAQSPVTVSRREGKAGKELRVFAGVEDWRASSGLCAQSVIWWPPRRWSESAMAVPQAPEPKTAMRLMLAFWLRSGIPCRASRRRMLW